MNNNAGWAKAQPTTIAKTQLLIKGLNNIMMNQPKRAWKKNTVLASALLLGTLANTAQSNATWRPVAALSVGVSSSSQMAVSQNIPILNPITDEFYNYYASKKTVSSGIWDVLLAAERALNAAWILQTGIDYNQSTPFTAKGYFVQGADVQSADTYGYHYKVEARQLLVNGKLLYALNTRLHPYLFAGLGASFNRTYNYTNTTPINLTFSRMYLNNSHTSFSYALGIGVDADITSQLRVGIGYRYAGLGTVRLGNAYIDTTPVTETLSRSNIQANEMLVQLSWLFN